MPAAGTFNVWWGLLALFPLILYIFLVFRDMEPLPATIICIIVGAAISGIGIVGLGNMLVKAMSSFLAVVGLIIMLGRGLGEVMTATKVSHTLVHKIIYGIGIDTQKKAMLGISISCFIIVGLLGTMAGGNAILAPIVIPVAASVGLSRSTMGVIFHAVGEEALIVGPFTPPVVTLLGLTGLTYGTMLFYAALPIATITLIITWINMQRIQRDTEKTNPYPEQSDEIERFVPTKESSRATAVFSVLFIAAIVYGLFKGAGTSFVVIIMLGLSMATGFAGGLNLDTICKHVIKGMAGNVGLFLLFLILDPFIGIIEGGGGFKALTVLLQPLVDVGGKASVIISGGLIGAFGISGATVAELKMLHSMFADMLKQNNVSMVAWSVALIIATRVTNFIYPGANMFSSMGFAQSSDIKALIRNGFVVAIAHTCALIFYAYVLA